MIWYALLIAAVAVVSVETSPRGGVSMRKLFIMTLTALASTPVIGLAAIGAAAPVFADTPAQGPACGNPR